MSHLTPTVPHRRYRPRRLLVAAATATTTLALLTGMLAPSPGRALDPDSPPAAGERTAGSSAGSTGSSAGALREARATARARGEAAKLDRVRVPRIRWGACGPVPAELRARLRCATVRVPLDYDRPRGATTRLNLTKFVAAAPKRRIGSLFVNPGGPGGPASGFVPFVGELLGGRVDRRFDVVGVDPRGTGGSPLTCRVSLPPRSSAAYPVTRREVARQLRADVALRRGCRERGTPLVDHASTADVARDHELVRRALGEPRMSYYGISYGSYLGATYAAMFPDRVRALVVDGVLDPIAWSRGPAGEPATRPFSYRLRSGYGSYEALTAAWTECDRVGPTRCDLAAGPVTALGKWRAVLAAARRGDLRADGVRVAYQDVVGLALGALYEGRQIRSLAAFVADLYASLNPPATLRRGPVDITGARFYRSLVAQREDVERRGRYAPPVTRPVTRPGTGTPAPTFGTAVSARRAVRVAPVFNAVTCSDSRNPHQPRAWERAARVGDRRTPWFGRLWAWASSSCAQRGVGDSSDAFRGPWLTRTAYPVLVVGNSHDPATPVSGARRLTSLMIGSRFVLWDGWNHGALGGGSCITRVMGDYLVERTLPRNGIICRPPTPLYG